MASITCSSDQRLSTSKRRLKPLMLRDYLLDDLSSCSSNGFKSFPRRQHPPSSSSSTVRRLLDTEMKRSGLIHKPRLTRRSRTTCGMAISNAVHKASTAFLNAVKLLPFHATVKIDEKQQQGVFFRSFSKRSFWRKPASHSRREVTVTDVGDGEIQWWRSAAFFPDEESLDQPSDLFSQISTVAADESTFSVSEDAAVTTTVNVSSSSGSDFFTNSSSSEVVQSSSSSSSSTSSGESEEVSNQNDPVEDGNEIVESLDARDCDGSSANSDSLCNRKECVNEEKEQLSPVSILECPFEDDEDEDDDEEDEITGLISHHNDTYEKNARKSSRVNGLVRLEPLELEKRIEKYVEREEDEEYSYHVLETEEDETEKRANRLFALVKSRIGETNNILASNVADNLLLDYLQEDNIGAKEETLMVKKVEDWLMDRQEEMFMSWEVREKRDVYLKEMKWGCISGDEKKNVVEELANGFFTLLVDEFIFDLALG
ncbi:GAR2-like protein [Hirschfeldia incana]|nr:GAR2-like protein [Hirschfeldia incana]